MILWHFLNHPASLKQIPPHVIFVWQKSIFCEEAPQHQCPAKPCECHFLTTWHRGKKWPDYTLRFVMGLLQCQPNPAKLLDSMSWKTTWISSKWYQMYEMPTSWLNPQRYIFCISCLFVLFDSSGALRACCFLSSQTANCQWILEWYGGQQICPVQFGGSFSTMSFFFFATGPRRIVFAKRTTALKVARQRRSRQLKPNTQQKYLRLTRWMNVEFWWSQNWIWNLCVFRGLLGWTYWVSMEKAGIFV